MNIGLQFLNQIRGTEQDGTPSPDEQDPVKKLGGWVAQQLTSLVAALTASYHKEHNSDDTHSTIHATGSIAERGRTTALGEWIDVPFASLTFAGNGTQTWAPSASTCSVRYMLVGKTVFVSITISLSTVGGVPNSQLIVKFSDNFFVAKSTSRAYARVSDNGVVVTGEMVVDSAQNTRSIFFVRQDFGNFAASAANTAVSGTLFYEVV